ncbi:hypothetical protein SHKM778_00350 [Streptomyces sp. KM77-8]|uniref:PPM-type phosphatase domain-containing protein n=1 Tax=Streptomyces haneummycinicus TaxID=3074435 RepID=A0AAT9H8A8_9ACTN
MVEEDPQLEGMGTTLTALLWTGQRLGMVHVGDSRAYLLRDGVLTQITQDHTWVQRLVDEGRITEEEATTHPQRSLLMRALGSGEHVEPDLSIREVRAGDRYLICSDGLSGVVSHQTLEEALASYQGPEETVQNLIELALRGGGPDNITVIVADVLDLDTGDTLAGQLSDTPVVVGAVAENQNQLHDNGIMQTPAGRASGLGRRRGQGGGGEFGPPGSGDVTGFIPTDGFDYGDDDFTKPVKNRRWLKRSVYSLLTLAVLGGGLYGGWRWTQTQYYVGANGEHVALYQGISQDLAWVSSPTWRRTTPRSNSSTSRPTSASWSRRPSPTATSAAPARRSRNCRCRPPRAGRRPSGATARARRTRRPARARPEAPREPLPPPSRPRPRRRRTPRVRHRPRSSPRPRPKPHPPPAPAPASRRRSRRSSRCAVSSRQAVRGPVTR